jgi:hypothetical protein
MTENDWLDYCAAVMWNEYRRSHNSTYANFPTWTNDLADRFRSFKRNGLEEKLRSSYDRISTGTSNIVGKDMKSSIHTVPDVAEMLRKIHPRKEPALYLDLLLSRPLLEQEEELPF